MDSLFFSVEKLLLYKYPNIDMSDSSDVINHIIMVAKEMQSYLNLSLDYFASKFLNLSTHKFNLKQEIVAKTGFWTTKKRYALWAVNIDGRPADEIEIKGLDVVRTSFPKFFKNFMMDLLKNILHGESKTKIDSDIIELRKNTNEIKYSDVARPTGAKEISKFTKNHKQVFNFKFKGTPAHIKACVNYNDFIRYFKMENRVQMIGDNEKIKWVYLIPENPYRLESLAFRDNGEDPEEILKYIETYIDRKKIFDSEMDKKLQDFYDALGWGTIPTKIYSNMSKYIESE